MQLISISIIQGNASIPYITLIFLLLFHQSYFFTSYTCFGNKADMKRVFLPKNRETVKTLLLRHLISLS